MTLKPPFPFFGSKRSAAAAVWSALGDPGTYIEPFAGSLAVLLGRPTEPGVEIAVDSDGLIVNFWRWLRYLGNLDASAQEGALAVAYRHINGPLSEDDVEARHRELVRTLPDIREKLRTRPDWFNTRLAMFWWQGQSAWLGSGWCRARAPEDVRRQRPHIDRTLKGLYAVGAADGRLLELAERLTNVTLLSGDWTDAWRRPITTSILDRLARGAVGVFLDPPYTHASGRARGLYGDDSPLSDAVGTWCLEHGDNPELRIVLAGYEDEYPMLPTWNRVHWRRPNGYANVAENRRRSADVLFLSPHCLEV